MLQGDWPVGAAVIPSGTVLGDDAIPPPTTPLPINAMALDDEAAHQMCLWYDESNSIGGWHELRFAHHIDHEAVKAKARHAKRWPNGEPAQTTIQPIRKDPTDAEVQTQTSATVAQAKAKAHKAETRRQPRR
jgi:hypothetical protein